MAADSTAGRDSGPRQFQVARPGHTLAAEEDGSGPPIVLVHGLTATRRYVVHGSRTLVREGYRVIGYDARGHGESDPAPSGSGYSFAELASDLAALLDDRLGPDRCVLAGHSMGAHTLARLTLDQPERVAAIVAIGPVFTGAETSARSLAGWDALANGLEQGGVEGFVAAYDHNLDPDWRETLLRIARQRLELHRHPQAVAEAMRQVPRSRPFERLEELAALELPALVVASHDEADPGHPFEAARQWAEVLPKARLVSEEPGSSPLAWQGGRLSREIAAFCGTADVVARF